MRESTTNRNGVLERAAETNEEETSVILCYKTQITKYHLSKSEAELSRKQNPCEDAPASFGVFHSDDEQSFPSQEIDWW